MHPGSGVRVPLEAIAWYLPDAAVALEIKDHYHAYATWMYDCIPKD
jgi:hypothetical protein